MPTTTPTTITTDIWFIYYFNRIVTHIITNLNIYINISIKIYYRGDNMNKLFTLEVKGEIVAMLTHKELGYMDFVRACKDIEAKADTKDMFIMKGILIEEYQFEEVGLLGGYEVSKRKGAL